MASSRKKCEKCKGAGKIDCLACGGHGEQSISFGQGDQKTVVKCRACSGSGKRPCVPCGGSGQQPT